MRVYGALARPRASPWWPSEGLRWRRHRDAFAAVVPYIPVTIIYLAIHLLVLQRVSYSRTLATPARTLLTAPSLLLFYLRTLVFPAVISPHYNFKLVTAFSAIRVLLPCLVLIAAAVLLYLSARGDRDRSHLTAFASTWILLPLRRYHQHQMVRRAALLASRVHWSSLSRRLPFDFAQGPEPACGEPVEPVEGQDRRPTPAAGIRLRPPAAATISASPGARPSRRRGW